MFFTEALSYFVNCPLILKLFWISLLCMLVCFPYISITSINVNIMLTIQFFSLINIFAAPHDLNGWLCILAFYCIHQGAISVLFVFVLICGFTLVTDLIRLITLRLLFSLLLFFRLISFLLLIIFIDSRLEGYTNKYWTVMTIFGMVCKCMPHLLFLY